MAFTTGPIVNQSFKGFAATSVIMTVLNNSPSFTANVEIVTYTLTGPTLNQILIGHDLFTLNVSQGFIKKYPLINATAFEVQFDYFSAVNIAISVFGVDNEGHFVPGQRILTPELTVIDRLTI
jgi:hypothetical protein